MEFEKELSQTLEESISTKRAFWSEHKADFYAVAERLLKVIADKKKVLIFGNGGSACDALHFSGEWVNRYSRDRRPLPCLALTADTPLITCIGNDASFDVIFEKQIQALGQPGDVAFGISTSGNSKNVILALQAAREQGMTTVCLLGGEGGKILKEKLSDLNLLVDGSKYTPRIQETHEWILHSLCEYIDFKLIGPRK